MCAELRKLTEEARAILDLYRTIENPESKTEYTLHEKKEIYGPLESACKEESAGKGPKEIDAAIEKLRRNIEEAIEDLKNAVMISGVHSDEPDSTVWGLTECRGGPYVFPRQNPREWKKIRDSELRGENVDNDDEIKEVQVAILKLYFEPDGENIKRRMLSVQDIINGVLTSNCEGLRNTHLDNALIQCGIDDLHCQDHDKVLVITGGAVPLNKKLDRKTMECIIFEEEAKKFLKKNGE